MSARRARSSASSTVREMIASVEPILWFASQSTHARHGANPTACDFTFGNPHEMPLPEIQRAITKWAVPQNKDWFAYRLSDSNAISVVVESLRRRHGIDFDPADVSMTNGAFAALAAALRAVVDPGDEVIYLSPPWFFYVPMIISLGAMPVRVDLPQPVYLISDEAYSRILFDGSAFHTPLRHYARSFLLYTYGKTLLTPGQRMGYIAMPPTMPDRGELRQALFTAQIANGWAFPNAVMQYAIGDLEPASIDVPALQRRRDRVVSALSEMGYDTVTPMGTFYVLVRSPMADDVAFAEQLAQDNVFVMPGNIFELPGWFRISLTANDDIVDRALPAFEKALLKTRKTKVS